MKTKPIFLSVVCVLLVCVPASGQEDILSAIPADAYGFVATKNLQASYDNIMLFARAIGAPAPKDNKLLPIRNNFGEIDLNGPAAVVLLDPQKFSEPPVAVLLSAADAEAVFQTHKAKALDTNVDLPAGVIKGPGGYLAVKRGFVVFAPKADHAAAVLASQEPLAIMPAARKAFEKGQIVLAGDLRGAAPFMIQTLNTVRAQMNAQMAGMARQMPQMAAIMDMVSIYMDVAESLVGQSDKLTVSLDVNAEQAVLTKRVLFRGDSPAADFLNAHRRLDPPSYEALPAGPFLVVAGASVVPENMKSLSDAFLKRLADLPSLKKELSAEQLQEITTAANASAALISGMAFTFNIGSPATGMLDMVARYDVSDVALYRQLSEKESDIGAMWSKAFGTPLDFIYSRAAENYSGVDIDTYKMQITPPEPGAQPDPVTAQQMQMLPMLYGPDMTFRLAAPNDEQVLFVMGGAGRMERAINVAQGNGSVLANNRKIMAAAGKLPANRFAEAHLDLGQVLPMIGMLAAMSGGGGGGMSATPGGQDLDTPLISFSASAEDNALRMDLVVPAKTVRTLTNSFGGTRNGSAVEEPSENFEED